MDNPDTENRYQTNAESGNNTANLDAHSMAIDSRKNLAGYDGTDDTPAYLEDDVQDTSDLGRPISHEVTAKDLSDTTTN